MERMNGMLGVVVSSIAVLVVALVGWFVFVSPQRAKADRLDSQIRTAQGELARDQALLAAPRQKETRAAVAAAERAMPKDPQVSEILRQLAQFAAQSRTELDSISPGPPTPAGTAQAIPITLNFKGRYFALQKLLRLLHDSADVKHGKLIAKGRLYTVDGISFNGGGTGGDLTASISLNAFTYGGAVAPTATPTPTDTTATTTTSG